MDEPPARRGRLFWICLLVLIEAAAWSVASIVTDSGTVRMLVALAVGGGFVLRYRDHIWGPDWREQLAEPRARQPNRRR
ncbi:hypothetical protein SK069_17085 [Patulibacter brassicae]|uniref:DUF2530 domain-containing protein n=1 Tax=Patulibacter brassicae TaxID=1705717 RepID=A0ABU4VQV3_9ACTN|nr:hypothetical protein [Patulibacter brassicae]MDX8153316.1 hypothetical protein [Patulibacter brassicae]